MTSIGMGLELIGIPGLDLRGRMTELQLEHYVYICRYKRHNDFYSNVSFLLLRSVPFATVEDSQNAHDEKWLLACMYRY
jgi:hypothetical protein